MSAATTLVSVTRFRLRSIRFMPFFMIHANRTIAQICKADGFIDGAVHRENDLAFWTLTLWRDEHAMRAYSASGAHRKAMPHLADWADEASVVHGMQDHNRMPSWPEAVRRLRDEGRFSQLHHPAPNHAEHRVLEPRMTHGMRL